MALRVARRPHPMIDLYYDATPNGRKALIMLEEIGLPYTLNWVEIGKGHQFEPDFMAISPNSKNPGDHRSRRPGRRNRLGVRDRRHSAVPRRKDWQVSLPRSDRTAGSHQVAVLADFKPRAVCRPGGAFHQLRRRPGHRRHLRHRALSRRSQEALWRVGQPPVGPALHCGRFLDRRHRHLPLGAGRQGSSHRCH